MLNKLADDIGHKIIDGRAHARELIEKLRPDVADLVKQGWQPHLVSVTVGDVEEVGL
jgi:5,10-methylene-tetrahydrofolate dehydrogenase/methenyl tetrahydrofolate cyclohydrolase